MAAVAGLNSPSAQEGHVVGAIDDNMVYPLLVWAWSLLRTAQRPLFFTIGFLEGTLSASHRRELANCLSHWGVRHEFRELDMDERFISQGHISPTTFTKFLLADSIPGPHLWVDVDAVGQKGWDGLFDAIEGMSTSSLLLVAERNRTGGTPSGSNQLAFNAGVLGWPTKDRRPWSAGLDDMDVVETQEQQLFNDLYGDALELVSNDFNTLSYQVDSLRSDTRVPRILHFAGPQKPWQLPDRFRGPCHKHQCPWSVWFAEEALMLASLPAGSELHSVLQLRRASSNVGSIPVSRSHRGRLLLWLLSVLGPFGWVLIGVGAVGKRLVPSGTHPLH